MKTVLVVGNPRSGSRTGDAAARLAAALGASEIETIELSEFGPALLDWGNAAIKTAQERVRSAELVIVASPTFKASYTGLLKLFLDQFATHTGLAGLTVVPLMLGAGEAHALAPELLLKPVLVELGATCPAPGIYLLDSDYSNGSRLQEWLDHWTVVVRRSAAPDMQR